MAQVTEIQDFLSKNLDEKYFIVEIKYNSSEDKYFIFVDTFAGITLKECETIHRKLNDFFEDKMDADFALEVSSPGLTSELKVWQQYKKNINSEIKIITNENQTIEATVIEANTEEVTIKFADQQTKTIKYSNIKKAKSIIKF